MAERGPDHRFIGRAETVEEIRRRLDEVRAGKGGVALLLGDTGVGKSTLLAAITSDIRARGIRVLAGRALAVDDPPPFSLIYSSLESEGGDPGLSPNGAPRSGNDPTLVDRDAHPVAPPPSGSVDPNARLLETLGVLRDRTKIAPDQVLPTIADRFLGVARQGPTALLLDDFYRADESSISAVEFLANHLQDQPLWILVTSRAYASLLKSKRARIEGFESATRAQRIVLRPLRLEEVSSYLEVIDPARRFSAAEVDRCYSETGGNPLLLQKRYRRASSGEGAPTRSGEADSSVDAEAQRTLEVAAVLGPSFSFDLLVGASGEDPPRLAKIVEDLVDRGLLIERPGKLLEFPHDRLREEAYDHLTESQREVLHRRAGETRESAGGVGSPGIFDLARDFYLGKENRKSLEYNRFAAEISQRALAPDIAREFLQHALESQRNLDPDDLEKEAKLVLELGQLNYDLGRLEEAERILREFLDRKKRDARLSARLRATFELLLAQVLNARGDLGGMAGLAEKVLASPELEGDALIAIGAHRLLGVSLYYQGRYSESLVHNAEALRLARETGNEEVIARALTWHSGVLAMTGQADQALVEARQVADMLDRLGSPGESAQGYLFLGNMLADNKSSPLHRQEAIVVLDKAILLAEQAQDPRRVGWALYHTAELLREQARFKEADEKAERAYDTLGRMGDRVGQGVSIKVRGQIALARGDFDTSGTDLLEAQRLLRGLNHTLEEIDVLLRLAQLSSARGDRQGALGQVAELERMKLPASRPDLVEEFELLKRELATKEGSSS